MKALRYTAGLVAVVLLNTHSAGAQITQRNAQYWLPASYNNQFYSTFPAAARSFYAAHYAHFRVYEIGMRADSASFANLADEIRALIENPPRFEPPIDVIAPRWAKMGYNTAAAMDWTHHLHEQLYDILTDDDVIDKKTAGERAIAYYLTNRRAAFSTRGYGHAFMLGGGSWAGEFAEKYPEINGILWAYHWHHASVYEALLEEDQEARQRALDRVLRVFSDSVLVNPPTYMPLTAEFAPKFSAMFPAAAHIFDNLHMMHDVVNDVMVNEEMSNATKSSEIDRLLQQMIYASQDWVIPPAVPMGSHGEMPMSAMTIPTELPDGSWLPQGHPDAKMPPMTGMQHRNPAGRRQ